MSVFGRVMGILSLGGSKIGATKSGATGGVRVMLKDNMGKILMGTCTTIPTDTTNGYAKGCLLINTSISTGTTGLYVNVGTRTACVFKAVSNA